MSRLARPSFASSRHVSAFVCGIVLVPSVVGLLGVASVGCREKPIPNVYLGVVDAGGVYKPPNEFVPSDAGIDQYVPDTSIEAPPLTTTSCTTTFSVAGDPGVSIGGLALLPSADAVLIGQDGAIVTHTLDTNGCPVEESTSQPVDVGHVVGVQAFTGGITIVAGTTGIARISPSSNGDVTALCATAARGLAATSTSHAVVATGLNTLQPVDFVTDDTASCTTGAVTVDGSTLALAPSTSNAEKGWVALIRTDATRGAVTEIRRVDLVSGQLDAAPVIDASGALCGADAILELGGRLYVVDGGCSRVVVFNTTSGAVAGIVTSSDGTIPRALAALPSGDVLLASAKDSGGRSTISFSRISP